jgi:anti-anti-sigma factor
VQVVIAEHDKQRQGSAARGAEPGNGRARQFSVVSRRFELGTLVRVAGEIDLATAPELDRELRRAQRTAGVVVLDLTAVSFMDCSGLHVILDARRRAFGRGGQLNLAGVGRQPRRLFELTGELELTQPASFFQ